MHGWKVCFFLIPHHVSFAVMLYWKMSMKCVLEYINLYKSFKTIAKDMNRVDTEIKILKEEKLNF